MDARYDAAVAIGDTVFVDLDPEIRAKVTAVCFRAGNYQVEISWWNAGALQTAWVDPWRVTLYRGEGR